MWLKMDPHLSEMPVSEVKQEEDVEEEAAPSVIIPNAARGPQYETVKEEEEEREMEQLDTDIKEVDEIKVEEEEVPSSDDIMMSLSQEKPSRKSGRRRKQSFRLKLYETENTDTGNSDHETSTPPTTQKKNITSKTKEALHRVTGDVAFHCPVHVPPTPARPRKMGQRECIVCKYTTKRVRKRRLVTTMCRGCNVGLCLGDCYSQYHSLQEF